MFLTLVAIIAIVLMLATGVTLYVKLSAEEMQRKSETIAQSIAELDAHNSTLHRSSLDSVAGIKQRSVELQNYTASNVASVRQTMGALRAKVDEKMDRFSSITSLVDLERDSALLARDVQKLRSETSPEKIEQMLADLNSKTASLMEANGKLEDSKRAIQAEIDGLKAKIAGYDDDVFSGMDVKYEYVKGYLQYLENNMRYINELESLKDIAKRERTPSLEQTEREVSGLEAALKNFDAARLQDFTSTVDGLQTQLKPIMDAYRSMSSDLGKINATFSNVDLNAVSTLPGLYDRINGINFETALEQRHIDGMGAMNQKVDGLLAFNSNISALESDLGGTSLTDLESLYNRENELHIKVAGGIDSLEVEYNKINGLVNKYKTSVEPLVNLCLTEGEGASQRAVCVDKTTLDRVLTTPLTKDPRLFA
jgi:hypothetical protein